jgi:hypothetical protein
MLDRAALAAAELRHYLRLSLEIDEQGKLRSAVRKRVAEVTANLSPADQVWFVALLHEMSKALRGIGVAGNAMQAVLARVGGPETEAGAALAAPPRPYKMTSHGGAIVDFAPRIMTAFVVSDAANGWKAPAPSGAQVVHLASLASHGLMREQAPGLLEAAQAAWRNGSYDETWEAAVHKLQGRSHQPLFGWGPNHVAMMQALRAPDRIEGSPWLGPLKMPMTAALREGGAWEAVLRHVQAGDGGSKPSKTFAKTAANLLAEIGGAAFRDRVMGWLEQHPLDPALPDPDQDALKQLIWLVGTTGEAAAAPLGRLAQRCFVKVPNIGARSVKLGNAALAALGMVEPPTAGAAELDRLRQRVKYPSAQKQIETALLAAAKRAGLTTEDLAELAVPDFDLAADGTAHVTEPEGGAVLRLSDGRHVSLEWKDAAGKTLGSAPAALKNAHGALVKDWTERKRALDAMLSGQISRIEGFFEGEREWDATAWTQRYARHGLLGPLSRRLIWRVTRADGTTTAMLPTQTGLLDAAGREVALGTGDRVRLWHPIDASVDEVLAWRAAVVARGVVQPFKQAHREIYRLTDAERETETYSNRFGGHILRQHQMLALAKSRGWTATLQGSFDGANDPTKTYAEHGLRVSFGAEGIEGHDGDLSPHGICLRVATGTVTFRQAAPPESRKAQMASIIARMRAIRAGEPVARRLAAGPVKLADVPARLFSEAMRDVDLFVGVASLGADPAWADGGPNGRFGDYWRGFADGELVESGKARHAVLAAILPRLNIAPVCTLETRHLVVRGRLKTYRIHIGSGSIFFQPEGQYLCIVPARGAQAEVVLPFECDFMLSAILSKAVLLARDDLIKDQSILTQLRRSG